MLAAPARAETIADRWNLAEIYPSVAAWNADAAKLEGQFKDFAGCKGHLGDGAARFKQCLDLQADMTKRYYRMAAFSSEQVPRTRAIRRTSSCDQKADVLGNNLGEATSFVDPEILHLGKDRVAQFLEEDPALAIYRFPLEQTLRLAPHTLSDEGEALVAKFGLMDNAGESAYKILTNADIPWPKVKLASGEEITLDESAYTKYRELPNRDDRKKVMDAFFGTFKTYERTIGVNAVLAAQAECRLREGAQLSGFDHARARPQQHSGRGLRHADPRDQREAADAAPVFPPAREDAGRPADPLLRHLSAAGAQRHQAAVRRRPQARAGGGGAARQRLRRRDDLRASTTAGWTPIRARRSSRARTWTATRTTCIRTC